MNFARPAATAILCRPRKVVKEAISERVPVFDYEILMVRPSLLVNLQRTRKAKFFPGAWVFPGGAVDEQDSIAAWAGQVKEGSSARILLDPITNSASNSFCSDADFRMAAIRELFEEANILLTKPELEPQPNRPKEIPNGWFQEWCSSHSAHPDLELLRPWARWITPEQEKKRFDTMFYVAKYIGKSNGAADPVESEGLTWMPPDQIIEQFHRQELQLPPPTYVCISEFLHLPKLDDVLRTAARRDMKPMQPHVIVNQEGKVTILLDGDKEHPRSKPAEDKGLNRLIVESMTKFSWEKSPDRAAPASKL